MSKRKKLVLLKQMNLMMNNNMMKHSDKFGEPK